jgi:hypothetical protein
LLSKKKLIEEWITHKSSVIEKSEKNLKREKIKCEQRRRLRKKIKLTKFKPHHKKRRLTSAICQLNQYEENIKKGKDFLPGIVFGSKVLLKDIISEKPASSQAMS